MAVEVTSYRDAGMTARSGRSEARFWGRCHSALSLHATRDAPLERLRQRKPPINVVASI